MQEESTTRPEVGEEDLQIDFRSAIVAPEEEKMKGQKMSDMKGFSAWSFSSLLKCILPFSLAFALPAMAQQDPIAQDAEYYILEWQLGQQWVEDDTLIDAKLAEFRETNEGRPPYIL